MTARMTICVAKSGTRMVDMNSNYCDKPGPGRTSSGEGVEVACAGVCGASLAWIAGMLRLGMSLLFLSRLGPRCGMGMLRECSKATLCCLLGVASIAFWTMWSSKPLRSCSNTHSYLTKHAQ